MVGMASSVNLRASVDMPRTAVNLKMPLSVDGLWRRAQHALLPPRCLICAQRSDTSRDLCAACRADFHANERCCARCALPLVLPAALCGECLKQAPPFDAAFTPFVYGHPLAHLITQLKFGHSLAAGRVVAELWVEALRHALAKGAVSALPEVVIPIPLHAQRLRERGYNQALELARPLARAFDLTLAPGLLARTRATPAQAELDAKTRRKNLRGAFAFQPPPDRPDPPASAVLLDDVMTTGATLAECARTLRRAGVARIEVWAFARAPRLR